MRLLPSRRHRTVTPAAGAALLALAGCMTPPPEPPAPREPAEVAAPAARTWDAVVDVLAERSLAVASMDRAGGFVRTEPVAVAMVRRGGPEWARCSTAFGVPLGPDKAVYSVTVRGDSARSTVRASVRWTRRSGDPADPEEVCTTANRWESAFEAAVKARAERAP
jgi:hypothetical protein